jgi:hypothetical protein
MAKKSAPKKKAAPAKPASKVAKKPAPKVAAKAAKTVAKPVAKSSAKPAPAAKVTVKPVAKSAVDSKPALMTKKGKAVDEEVEETKAAAKNQTVVSMIEADANSEEPSKAEKVSKIKPVKIERGNLSDEKAKWVELNKKYGKDKAVPYKMSEKFQSMIPMQHKVLGWGFILTNENDRLEVLFETGIRMLISNYKA